MPGLGPGGGWCATKAPLLSPPEGRLVYFMGNGSRTVAKDGIDAIRAMLAAKPRPVGWAERRVRLDEVGAVWPVADDISGEPVDCGGVPGEWSLAPGAEPSRVLMFFHGGGYCAGSIVSHRRLATEAGRAARMRTLAIGYHLAPEHPYPAAHEDALAAWRFLRGQGIAAGAIALGGAPRARKGPPASGSPRPGPTSPCRAQRSPRKTPTIRSSTNPISKSSPTPTRRLRSTAPTR